MGVGFVDEAVGGDVDTEVFRSLKDAEIGAAAGVGGVTVDVEETELFFEGGSSFVRREVALGDWRLGEQRFEGVLGTTEGEFAGEVGPDEGGGQGEESENGPEVPADGLAEFLCEGGVVEFGFG